jgi:hypothetical protein
VFGPGPGEMGVGLTRLRSWVDWAGIHICSGSAVPVSGSVWPVPRSDSGSRAFSRPELTEASLESSMVVDELTVVVVLLRRCWDLLKSHRRGLR